MWYVIICGVIFLAFYVYSKRKMHESTPPVFRYTHHSNESWEETKKQKARTLKHLKKSFRPAPNIEAAIEQATQTLISFHENHGQSSSSITAIAQSLNFPDDLIKKESALRKEIRRFYKKRTHLKSKAIAIHLSFEHAKLQLQNPDHVWKNFSGLQKLQANWKAEEYFDGLLVLMTSYEKTFSRMPNVNKLSSEIARIFELWNSRNVARCDYQIQLQLYKKARSASDKHFIILSIIKYLDRRYKFNPLYKNELVRWCVKDIALYENFLKEFHENDLFSLKQQVAFHTNPSLRQEKLAAIKFLRIKNLKKYTVPKLPSYDVLNRIYEAEDNVEGLQWLKKIRSHIGYGDYPPRRFE